MTGLRISRSGRRNCCVRDIFCFFVSSVRKDSFGSCRTRQCEIDFFFFPVNPVEETYAAHRMSYFHNSKFYTYSRETYIYAHRITLSYRILYAYKHIYRTRVDDEFSAPRVVSTPNTSSVRRRMTLERSSRPVTTGRALATSCVRRTVPIPRL